MDEVTIYRIYSTDTDRRYLGLSAEPTGTCSYAEPMAVRIPTGWGLGEDQSGKRQLYDALNRHAHLILYRDHVRAVTSAQVTDLAIVPHSSEVQS